MGRMPRARPLNQAATGYVLAVATIDLTHARLAPSGSGPGWLARGASAVVWSPDASAATGGLLSSWLSTGPEELLANLASGFADPAAKIWPPFAAMVARDGALVVVLHGPVEVTVGQEAQEQVLRAGDDKGSWLSRTFTQPGRVMAMAADPVTGLGRGGTTGAEMSPQVGDDLVNLVSGLVRAGGFSVYLGEAGPSDLGVGGGASAEGTADGQDEAAPALPEPRADRLDREDLLDREAGSQPAPGAGGGGGNAPAGQHVGRADPSDVGLTSVQRVQPAGSSQPTVDRGSVLVGARPPDATVVEGAFADATLVEVGAGRTPGRPAAEVTVRGVYCPNGHFNDPRLRACRRCGARLAPGAAQVEGPRPSLGFLTWDDGEVSPLGTGALVGREVALDEDVQAGRLSPVVPAGTNDSMSRVHAELRAAGWQATITDRGSTNGTFIWDEVTKTWQRLVPGEPQAVEPGTVLAFGERTATFDG